MLRILGLLGLLGGLVVLFWLNIHGAPYWIQGVAGFVAGLAGSPMTIAGRSR